MDFPCELAQGDATISIVFQGVVQDSMEGFYRAKHDPEAPRGVVPSSLGSRDAYTLVTQFEPCDARTAFPCFDEPRLKATFDLQLEIPEYLTALANMPVNEIRSTSPGTKHVSFERTVAMSTYVRSKAPRQRSKAAENRLTTFFIAPRLGHWGV